jgi:hypothetical protein
MNPVDLARSCLEALSHPERSLSSEPVVGIRGSRKVPLPKKSFPRWRYVSNESDGKPTFYYPAKALLEALVYHGLVDLADLYQEEITECQEPVVPATTQLPNNSTDVQAAA